MDTLKQPISDVIINISRPPSEEKLYHCVKRSIAQRHVVLTYCKFC